MNQTWRRATVLFVGERVLVVDKGGSSTGEGVRLVRQVRLGLAVLLLWLLPTFGKAQVTFSASAVGNDANETNSASVEFGLSISGTTTNLLITLSNTALYDPNDSPDILTAVFFTLAGNPSLSKVSAAIGAGNGIKDNGGLTDPGGVVGGEWGYLNSLSGAPNGANQGISSAGFTGMTMFGPSTRFPGNNLQGPNGPDGVQYGISTLYDTFSNDNGGLVNQGLITNSVVFTLGNVPGSFALTDISNVSFQYGTTLSDQNIPVVTVPEPSSIALTTLGFVVLALARRRRR